MAHCVSKKENHALLSHICEQLCLVKLGDQPEYHTAAIAVTGTPGHFLLSAKICLAEFSAQQLYAIRP